MSSVSVACLTAKSYYGINAPTISKEYKLRGEISKKAITVEDESVILNPEHMKVGQFYSVEVDNLPYLYRKINDHEIEVYGLAE
jgi:hypothetical protein